MTIRLKVELDTWAAALKAYDEHDFQKALELFSSIACSSKILTNMGLIYASVGKHEAAIKHFTAATNLDSYLAIAHFQCGVCNFLLARYDLALLDFEDAHFSLRGNETINYEQLGLKFKLFSAEILFNKGLSRLNLGYAEQGMADMREANRQKVTDEQGVIDEAIRDRGEGYTVFSIPIGVLYRPPEIKIKNSKSKDYLGKAKLVAASDIYDAFTEFKSVKGLRQALGENKEDESEPDLKSSGLSRSVPRRKPVTAGSAALERSTTTPQLGAGVRLDVTTILASQRTQRQSPMASTFHQLPRPQPQAQKLRRKMTRRPTARREPVYDDGDDGFATGKCGGFEMANIRVKLHYQGDVRGMTIPPTITFNEFVQRVATKVWDANNGAGDEDWSKG